jgi:acetyl coenzyme A synthetase (ADP forming)-like protein
MRELPNVKDLFEARSLAVIGASATPGKIGYSIVRNIVNDGYTGKLYPVNPKGGEVLGHQIYKSLKDIPGEVDVAVITVPSNFVFDAVKECAEKGVKFLPIITSGFSEIGNKDEEKQIIAYALEHGMRVLGPNIFGYSSSKISLNAAFGPNNLRKGGVAIITQSGALGIAMMGKTTVECVGLSCVVSIGNKADLDEADLLEYLEQDPETRVILMYIEGVQKGQRLLSVLERVTRKKPVVVIKSGRSSRGAMAAASHTGSLAGADNVFEAVMKQAGVMRAESLDEAFAWCKFLTAAPAPKGENTCIVTNGGGVGVMATDAAEKYGLNLYDDQHKLKEIFSPVTPEFGSTKNPVDITGQAGYKEYSQALDAALNNPAIHSVVALYCETAVFTAETLQAMMKESYEKYQKAGKPLLFSIIGGEKIEKAIVNIREDQIPVFPDVYQAVSCMGALYTYSRHAALPVPTIEARKLNVPRIKETIAKAKADGRTFLLPWESKVVMDECGIRMPRNAIARSHDEAIKLAKEVGYPLVMKVASKDIIHKSDAGGVKLNIVDDAGLVKAYDDILSSCKKYKADAKIDGMELCEQVKLTTETIVGARRDASFGPTVMFGLGGIYVEVLKDVVFRSLPVSRQEAKAMVASIRAHKLLEGVRGEKPKDIDGVADVILGLGALIQAVEEISDIEVNPIVVNEAGKGVIALDVRILLY